MANLDIFEREDLTGHVRKNSPLFRSYLEKLNDLPIVGDVRGDGYFFGIEMVKDKATKETFDDDESERLLRGFLSKALFDAGLYCRADDRGDPVIQLAPPLICDETHFAEIEQILRGVLTEAWTQDLTHDDRLPTRCRYWLSSRRRRPHVRGRRSTRDIDVDVAIVGAGFTGLWTAYYLAAADPTLRIAVIESEIAGLRRVRSQRRLVLGAVPAVGAGAGQAARPGSGDRAAPGDAGHGRRGRSGRGGRGHRLRLPQGRHRRARPLAAAARAGPRRGGRVRRLRARPVAARPPTRRGSGAAPPASSAARTRPTAPRSTRRSSCAAWPPRSAAAASRSTSRPGSSRSARASWSRRTARVKAAHRGTRNRGLHVAAARACGAPWHRSTR